jgi:hypothetical protein
LSSLLTLLPQVNQATYSICPHCSKIAKANSLSSTVSRTVLCECKNSYCFGCGMSPHVPATCRDVCDFFLGERVLQCLDMVFWRPRACHVPGCKGFFW